MSDEQQSVQPVETTEAGEPAIETALESDPRTHRFECRSCGYVYDPERGQGSSWPRHGGEDLGAGFPLPRLPQQGGRFRDIGPRAKASGFDENLDFGLGVNRMTPGQKNVLIFGSLASASHACPFIPYASPPMKRLVNSFSQLLLVLVLGVSLSVVCRRPAHEPRRPGSQHPGQPA